jgi:hypothetical protein
MKYKNAMLELSRFNIDESIYKTEKQKLFIKFGGEPSDYDITWSILNGLLRTNPDARKISDIYNSMASVCNLTNRDPAPFLREYHKFYLKYLIELRDIYPKVRIMSNELNCEACGKLHGKIMKLEDALREVILPPHDCTHKLMGKFSFCLCYFEPITEAGD